MFIPLIKDFLTTCINGLFNLFQITGFYVITFTFNKNIHFFVPIIRSITVRTFNMNVNRFMLTTPEEETETV